MTKGFFRSIVGLAVLLLLLLVTTLNVWQSERIERREVEILRRLDAVEKSFEAGVRSGPLRAGGDSAGTPVGAAETDPAYVLEAYRDSRNLLSADPDPWLPADADRGGTLFLHLGQDSKGFNWTAENGADVQEINVFVNEFLIARHRLDPMKRTSGLAYSMVEEDDGKTYLFKLRPDFLWHEPAVEWASGRYEWLRGEHKVTAQDLVFFMDMVMNDQVSGAAPKRSYFENLVGYEALDNVTFRIRFSKKAFSQYSMMLDLQPIPRFLYGFDEDGHPYDKEILGQKFQDHWYNPRGIGCGPYRFVSWEQGVALKLERDPKYPRSGNGFDKVVYSVLTDQGQWPRKLRTGELSLAQIQPGQYRSEVLEGAPDSPFRNGTLKSGTYWEYGYFYVGWNSDRPMFGDRRVRRAMSHAFQADMLLKDVFVGLGERTTGPVSSFSPSSDPDLVPIPFDLDAARRLLDEAGWTDSDGDGLRDKVIDGRPVKFEFTLMTYGSSDEYRTLGNIFKEDLAKVGVRMNVQPIDWANFLKKMDDKEFDAATAAWAQGPDVDFYQIWHSSQADVPKGSNRIGFRNAEADKLIEALQVEFDTQKRIDLARQFHRIIYDEQPYTFFYTRKRAAFWQQELQHVEFGTDRPHKNHRAWYLRGGGSAPTAP